MPSKPPRNKAVDESHGGHVLLPQILRQHPQFRVSLCDAPSRLQCRDDRKEMCAAIGELLRRKSRWYPKVRVLVRKGKPRRHNTNDRIFLAIEKDSLPDHIPVSPESAQPEPVAEQHDMFRTCGILFGLKNTPYKRLDPQNRKQIVSHAFS